MKDIHKSAWIHIVDRKMLFLRNEDREIFYLPGGRREAGETDEEALVREMKEELTIDLKPETIELVQHYSADAHGQENTKVEVRGYFADFEGEIVLSNEIVEMNWFNTSDKAKIASAAYPLLDWLKDKDLID